MSARSSSGAAAVRSIRQDVILTLVSVVVVVIVAWMLFMPPGPSMAITVEATAASGPITLYGRVIDQNGAPVRGASVIVIRDSDSAQVAALSTAEDGTFNTVISGDAGSYRIVASASVGGRGVRDSTRIDMSPDHAYGVSIELQRREFFLFLPLPSY